MNAAVAGDFGGHRPPLASWPASRYIGYIMYKWVHKYKAVQRENCCTTSAGERHQHVSFWTLHPPLCSQALSLYVASMHLGTP